MAMNNNDTSGSLRTARVLHTSFLIAIFAYIIVLYAVERYAVTEPILSDATILNTVTILLVVMGVASLALGFVLPRRIAARYKHGLPPNLTQGQLLLTLDIVRCACFEAVAIYGLVLGILGSGWEITLPFFIVAAFAVLRTIPTAEKWKLPTK